MYHDDGLHGYWEYAYEHGLVDGGYIMDEHEFVKPLDLMLGGFGNTCNGTGIKFRINNTKIIDENRYIIDMTIRYYDSVLYADDNRNNDYSIVDVIDDGIEVNITGEVYGNGYWEVEPDSVEIKNVKALSDPLEKIEYETHLDDDGESRLLLMYRPITDKEKAELTGFSYGIYDYDEDTLELVNWDQDRELIFQSYNNEWINSLLQYGNYRSTDKSIDDFYPGFFDSYLSGKPHFDVYGRDRSVITSDDPMLIGDYGRISKFGDWFIID